MAILFRTSAASIVPIRSRASAKAPVWWTKGDFYGDLEMRFELPAVSAKSGTMLVTLDGEKGVAGRGIVLSVTTAAGSETAPRIPRHAN